MSKFNRILSIVLAALAALLFLSALFGALGAGGIGFLFSTFHGASFYVPVYLGLCVLALRTEKDSEKLLLTMNFSLLPFLNLALLFHVISGNTSIFVSRYLITELGLWVSIPFLLILFAVECALIYKLGNTLYPDKPWIPLPAESEDGSLVQKVLALFQPKVQVFEDPYRKAVFEDEDQYDDSPDAESFDIPEMPGPIPPIETADDSEIQSLIASVLKPELNKKPVFNPPAAESPAESASVSTATATLNRAFPEEIPAAPVFNPNKTLNIDDVVDMGELSRAEADESHAEMDFMESGPAEASPVESTPWKSAPAGSAPADSTPIDSAPVEMDPGLGFLMDEEPVEDGGFPEDLTSEDEYAAQGYVTDRYEEIAGTEELPEALEPVESFQPVESVGPEDIPEELEEAPVSIASKLSPQGETEKLGVLSPGNIPKHKRKKYEVPVAGLLKEYPDSGFDEIDDYTRRQARALEETLNEFKIEASVVGISRGPVITMFEIQPSPGVKVSRIVNLQDNLALRLAASRIRIVAPIPGKQAIGIEVPNRKRSIVSYSGLVESEEFSDTDYEIPVILGKDISGGNQVIDLARTPHLLIAGSTGSGKSVCVNSLICSILYKRSPQEVKMMMVDPKIVELKLYNDIPHLLTPVITESKRAFQAVQWCLYEMERRYALLDAMGVRDIKSYNKRIKERDIATTKLPYIVLVIDEFADLMATSGKELEGIVARLAAMSRAVGIHLVLATQRPSIDVITGLIKANFPSRIAFMVASKTDSRIIIDMMGAEKLLGKGDMLFTSAWDPFPSRMQGAFLSEDEVDRVVSYVKTLGEPEYIDDEIFLDEDDYESGGDSGGGSSFSDPLYDKALDIVLAAGKASASYLQRRLQIGYNRAARLVEEMEIRGIVGPQNGSKPREVVHIPDRPGQEMLDTGDAPD